MNSLHESSDYVMVTMDIKTSHHTQGAKFYYIIHSFQGYIKGHVNCMHLCRKDG